MAPKQSNRAASSSSDDKLATIIKGLASMSNDCAASGDTTLIDEARRTVRCNEFKVIPAIHTSPEGDPHKRNGWLNSIYDFHDTMESNWQDALEDSEMWIPEFKNDGLSDMPADSQPLRGGKESFVQLHEKDTYANVYDWHMHTMFCCDHFMLLNGCEAMQNQFQQAMIEACKEDGKSEAKQCVGNTIGMMKHTLQACFPMEKGQHNWLGCPYFFGRPFVQFYDKLKRVADAMELLVHDEAVQAAAPVFTVNMSEDGERKLCVDGVMRADAAAGDDTSPDHPFLATYHDRDKGCLYGAGQLCEPERQQLAEDACMILQPFRLRPDIPFGKPASTGSSLFMVTDSVGCWGPACVKSPEYASKIMGDLVHDALQHHYEGDIIVSVIPGAKSAALLAALKRIVDPCPAARGDPRRYTGEIFVAWYFNDHDDYSKADCLKDLPWPTRFNCISLIKYVD